LILDCEMPVMNGLEALRVIMSECPLPVFMFSSLTREGAEVTIKALEYGAIDFMLKPTAGAHGLDEVIDDLVHKTEMVVLKWRFSHLARTKGVVRPRPEAVVTKGPKEIRRRKIELIAMGSSTGGVQAAMEVVPKLPENTKPIVWVQHMPPNFTKSFADRLNSVSKMHVKEAEDNEIIQDGTCYLGKGGYQLRVIKTGANYRVKVAGTDKVGGFCPACNVLFDSVTEYFHENVIGVIMTGMGDDGTKGLVKMHGQGGFVIGQSESSCVVYGMPAAAYNAGAVDVEVDLKEIWETIGKVGGY
ncbi:MAG TPA: chemotaxis-specific protein-glutamate methyltransferase CheB, partial [Candidatus Omnitrophota bacterium]|nr:chemotaxis-specific protein-glutamate methyltransferase CheB [Candidatus Omnitrophota bacterium]